MQARIDAQKVPPAANQAMFGLEAFLRKQSKLEPALLQLIKVRASQINGCAYCIDMHSKDARAGGETEQRIYALSAWEETALLYRPGARRAGDDGSDHVDPGRPRPRRALRTSQNEFFRGRAGRPNDGDHHHQRMEPAGDYVPLCAG
jgi:AhpD family alkylhydroperoxidase